MQINVQNQAEGLCVDLSGRLNLEARKFFQEAIEEAKSSTPHRIILNFLKVPFIVREGIGILMVAYQKLQQENIQLSLQVPRGYVYDVLTLTNMGKTIPMSTIES